jgi:hypothetical protein
MCHLYLLIVTNATIFPTNLVYKAKLCSTLYFCSQANIRQLNDEEVRHD